MLANKNHRALLKKLQKQVKLLQRKDEKARNQLRAAFQKMRKMGKSYQTKLAGKIQIMKSRIRQVQSSTYAKIAADIERQLQKSIEAKRKSLAAAISKFEKKHIAQLSKIMAKKAKKINKTDITKRGKLTRKSVRKKPS